MRKEKIKGIIIYLNEYTMSYLQDWLDAFKESDLFELFFIDINNISKDYFKKKIKELNQENIIILHHSVLRTSLNINKFKEKINFLLDRNCRLISFIGDEVNLHNSSIADKINILKYIKPDYVATQLLKETAEYLYSDLNVTILELPHALNEKVFKSYIPFTDRKYDLAAISVPYPIYLGDNDREKLFEIFHKKSKEYNLKINIIKSKDIRNRLNREGWVFFLNNTKGTISTEAGSFYLEKDNSTILEILEYLKKIENNLIISSDGLLKKIYDFFPLKKSYKIFIKNLLQRKLKFVKTDSDLFFDNNYFDLIYDRFYKNKEIPRLYGKAISSRHFDAIGTRTIQILVEGRYNDILKPYEHYIPIKRDFSNIDEAIEIFKDTMQVKKIIEIAYFFCLENHTYQHRLKKLYEELIL